MTLATWTVMRWPRSSPTALPIDVVCDVAHWIESRGHGTRRSGEKTFDTRGDRGAAERARWRWHVRIAGRHDARVVRRPDKVWPVHDRVESRAEYGHPGTHA